MLILAGGVAAHTFGTFIRNIIIGHIIAPIASLINMIYSSIEVLAETQVLSDKMVFNIFNTIQLVLAVFMIFRLMISIIQMIISPESGKNDEGNQKGATKFSIIVKRILLGLILIVLLRPIPIPVGDSTDETNGEQRLNQYVHNNGIIFGVLYDLQYRILHNHNLECLIMGSSCDASTENNSKNLAEDFSGFIIKSLVTPNFKKEIPKPSVDDPSSWQCPDVTEEDIENFKNMSGKELLSQEAYEKDCEIKEIGLGNNTAYFYYDYNALILILLLLVVGYLLVGFLIDIGLRSVKLSVLRLIAPIPVISYMSNDKDGLLANWVKNLTNTYIDLFVRLALLYLGFAVIGQVVNKGGVTYWSDGSINLFIKIIMSIAVLIFMKIGPKYIMDLLGIKGTGASTLGTAALMGGAARVLGGGSPAAFASGVLSTLDASTDAIAQGKAAPGIGSAYRQNADLQAKIRTGDKDAHGGLFGKTLDRLDYMNRESNAAKHMAGNRDLADAEFAYKAAQKQADEATKDYEIMKATGQDPTGNGYSLEQLYERKELMQKTANGLKKKYEGIDKARQAFGPVPRASDLRGQRGVIKRAKYRAQTGIEDMKDIGKRMSPSVTYRTPVESTANPEKAPLQIDGGWLEFDRNTGHFKQRETAEQETLKRIWDHDPDLNDYSGSIDETTIGTLGGK